MENRSQNIQLETYEWDNTWIEQAKIKDATRALYIGDSISCPVRSLATAASENTVFFDGVATSKAVDNPYLLDTVRLFAEQQGTRAVILLNNGLHGPHLEDETEYKNHYGKVIEFLRNHFGNTPLILILSTPQAKPERDERVVKRNGAVISLAEKYSLPVIDFYSLIKPHPELISSDGVHLTHDGYVLLANELAKEVMSFLNRS